VHEVSVRRYALGRYEITRAEWSACVLAKGCDELSMGPGDPQLPVTDVSWDQAQRYVAWLTQRTRQPYRLPSEAEWEYAVRAGSETQYNWGNVVEFACQNANGFDRAGRKAHPQWDWQIECNDGYGEAAPVGRYAPNGWGLYDMLGNVWEWVADCWHADYTDAPSDGRAWVEDGCAKRVNRGGGWGNHPRSLRVSNRDGDPAGARSDGLGFRVARDLP
jgi:formylglycine-generating enzyme required for sulfatase activity